MDSRKETFAEHYSDSMKPKKSDLDTEMELRGREMAADPMLEYFREKSHKEQSSISGKPIYRGHYPPNRYNIRPGHKWDGVDRSNGHEKKLLEREATLKAGEEESYRNATRDM